MKVTLISVYENIISYGMRSLSAVLKEAGVATQMIFLPRETEGFRVEGFRHVYPGAVLDQIAEVAGESDLIGITLMTNYFDNAVQITQHLHRCTKALIIWGGIHPTVRPEECLQYADLVCVGEGEEALRELVEKMGNGQGYAGVDNIWYKQNGDVVRTPLRPLQPDLDTYPYPDHDLDNEFILHQGHIQPMTPDLLLYYLRFPYTSESVTTYSTMMSRGCTYNCTYCCNNALRGVYHNQWRVRRRSVGNFIGELKQIVTRFPGIQRIRIDDDVFIGDVETLRQFRDAYKQAVNVPLFISGFQPPMIDEEIIDLLVDAGMKQIRVGIQTGSMRSMHQIYHRPVKREHIQRTFAVLHQFTDRIEPPIYDFILDNPWETKEDQLETLYMLLDIPKPYQLYLFSLTFYPSTELYDRAKREGILQDDLNQVYRKFYLARKHTYPNGLFDLFQSQQAPRWLMALLLHQNMRHLNLVWLPYLINGLFRVIQLSGAGWRALWRGDWAAFRHAFRARVGRYLSREPNYSASESG
jgi:anaerobic magnesium-protoporphyrin IX monomethyl ester cyclase